MRNRLDIYSTYVVKQCFIGAGAWTQGLHLEALLQPYFFCVCEGFFEIGSCKLFAPADIETWCSWSLPH
jgi:hypothetical protein